ncbi:MAG: sporulation integral membrane protein YtvI [Peptococcaceae bacterium]|nr:sporulation integral membrane protein YtvI [Peptococcaceae bacterium]
MIAGILLILKLFTYTVQDFLPVFSTVLGKLLSSLLPFILAFIFAFLIEPLVQKLIKSFKMKRTYSSFLVITAVAIFLILLLVLLGSRLYKELAELTTVFPEMYNRSVSLITEQAGIVQKYLELNPEIQNTIRSSSQDIIASLQVILKNGSISLLAFLGALPNFLIIIIITIVATLLTSISYPSVRDWFYQRVKGKYHSMTRLVVADLGSALVGFLRAELILVSVTSIVITIGLLILGNKYAFTIGILSGLLDLIPIIGPSLIFIPWIIFLFFTGALSSALKILFVYLAATVIRQILEPKILAQGIGIHPLPTLISIYVGLNLFGVSGLIIGPAIIVIYEALRKAGFFPK